MPYATFTCFYSKITSLVDKGKAVGVGFWDWNKAFDTVFHGNLPVKLSCI